MSLKNYEEIDEEDFYGQPFGQEGYVSIWIGMTDDSNDPEELDVLQDLCGVGYYDVDYQEMNSNDFEHTPLSDLLSGMSYYESFLEEAINAASKIGLSKVRWVLLQYEFAYDPKLVKREIADAPIFLGFFEYEEV